MILVCSVLGDVQMKIEMGMEMGMGVEVEVAVEKERSGKTRVDRRREKGKE